MFSPTDKYPEYWFTPGVVSHTPEFLTYEIVELVSRCSKTLYVTPPRSLRYRLAAGEAATGDSAPVYLMSCRIVTATSTDKKFDHMVGRRNSKGTEGVPCNIGETLHQRRFPDALPGPRLIYSHNTFTTGNKTHIQSIPHHLSPMSRLMCLGIRVYSWRGPQHIVA